MQEIYLAGGCFWGVQKYIDQFDGVKETETGYANGPSEDVSYEDVCANSGHAEAVRVVFDESVLPLKKLLRYYFRVIDPVSVNRQGNDVGVQYRTGIYYTDAAQLDDIETVNEEIFAEVMVPLAVEAGPVRNFIPAEEYHQKYLEKNPGGYCHISPAFFRLQEEENKNVCGNKNAGETDDELKERIGSLAYDVTQNAVTEQPFTGEYDNFFEKGLYVDVVSGEPLFLSTDKFDSGCGWPAFSRTVKEGAVSERRDASYGRVRTEIRSAGADSHLGHVFDDGPQELGGVRYCINSAALRFIPYEDLDAEGYGEWKDKIK